MMGLLQLRFTDAYSGASNCSSTGPVCCSQTHAESPSRSQPLLYGHPKVSFDQILLLPRRTFEPSSSQSNHHCRNIGDSWIFVRLLGACVGTMRALGEREDYMFWVVLLLYLLETVLCHFLFRRLLPSPHDSGHDVQQTDNSVEIVQFAMMD